MTDREKIKSYIAKSKALGINDFKIKITKNKILLESYKGNDKRVVIPDGITEIGSECFQGADIEEVYMYNSVESIGGFAFIFCNKLKKIRLSNRLKTIEHCAFKHCKQLETIELPENIDTINAEAFAYSGLHDIKINGLLKKIAVSAFYGCEKLSNIEFNSSELNHIGQEAFSGCSNLKKIEPLRAVKEIGIYAFYKTGITEIEINKDIDKVDRDFMFGDIGIKFKLI